MPKNKIAIPDDKIKPAIDRRHCARRGPGNPLFNQPEYSCPWKQRPQSPVREWAEMTENEKEEIRKRLQI